MLSLKLATSNLKKGFRSFAPFLLACVTLYVMMFLAASIGFSKSLLKLPGAGPLSEVMGFALVVLSIFGFIVTIYSYRFLQLQRSREFGLYDILGFGKSKIISVAFFELVESYLITVVVGSTVGIAFAKFVFLIFVNLIGGNYFNLTIEPIALILVAAIFLGIFLVLLLIGTIIISKSSSLSLLSQAEKGEKEPKANIIFAGLAVILLAVGYGLAATVDNPVTALTRFFIAVLLVIAGTYFFYISATVWYLKWRKKHDSYYQPQNFITISSMLYRMKANAAGLANITILLAMSLVTIVVTVGAFVGTRQMVMHQFHREVQVYHVKNLNDKNSKSLNAAELQEKTEQIAKKADVKISNVSSMFSASSLMVERHPANAQTFKVAGGYGELTKKTTYSVTLTTLDSLKSFGTTAVPNLSDNQVAIYNSTQGQDHLQNLDWYGHNYQVAHQLKLKQISFYPSVYDITRSAVIVFANDESFEKALDIYNDRVNKLNPGDDDMALAETTTYFDIAKSDQATFSKAFKASGIQNTEVSFRSDALQDQKSQIGGFVFIGFVLGLSFILGAALIIYYKQLSEGAQDKRSFKILQEVGLSKVEVQKTIKTQVRMLFFLPIVVTIVHFAFAYKMIGKLLEVFGVTDGKLMFLISIITILILAFLYWSIYKITSRVYYKIIER